ncbi:tRNA(Ile)-lysidine synthase [Fibrisoma limi BUZ 3]|uniref:tRNA(Ile)-lysidine synthase n=1 Tax=Fibrisoma limi BUZ 3 TaxID=1185876 RepID=I2GIM9_9BACT|nr:tRNA lysidine(34) synthetase TilS [Fibrisoma limi]CCH53754.1 tRNA(Ile)-lysidine synthase [Fibrisoma limi BUZ 3]
MLERDFLEFINENRLFGSADRVLLAVSGGLDSMVMTHLFHQIRQPIAIAHVNFGLRGDDSDGDARFVQNKAQQYGVPFHLTHFDTVAEAHKRGISIQMVARDLRYDWFAQLVQQEGYACVATAHHQNDVLETLLLNLVRGTGLAGLHGIAIRQNNLIRPLWFATRDELEIYAQEQGLQWREDSSNAEDKYVRNRLRHHVVPVLMSMNPSLFKTLPQTIGKLRAAETLMREELERSWQNVARISDDRVLLASDALQNLTEPVFRLAEWLKPYGFSIDQTAQMWQALRHQPGQVFQSATHRITHEREGLLLTPLSESADYYLTLDRLPDEPLDVEGRFSLTFNGFEKPTDFRPPTDAATVCFDADRLHWPLTIRPWQQGDRFRPLGLNGHKLVSDLLNDQKVSRPDRERTAVLLSDNQIAWVIGRRLDHRFRVTAETKRIVQVSMQ